MFLPSNFLSSHSSTYIHIPIKSKDVLVPELSQVSATRLTHSIQPVTGSSTAYSRKPPQLALFCVSVTGWASSLLQSREPYPSPRVSWCASCLDTYLHHETMNSLSVETLVISSLFPSSGPPWFFNSRQANIYAKTNTAAFKWNPAFFFGHATQFTGS